MFELTDEQRTLAQAAREFCVDTLGPTAKEDDEAERFRKEHMQALGEQGLCGIPTPEAYGGLGVGYLEYSLVLEEIARVNASYAVSVAVTGLPPGHLDPVRHGCAA